MTVAEIRQHAGFRWHCGCLPRPPQPPQPPIAENAETAQSRQPHKPAKILQLNIDGGEQSDHLDETDGGDRSRHSRATGDKAHRQGRVSDGLDSVQSRSHSSPHPVDESNRPRRGGSDCPTWIGHNTTAGTATAPRFGSGSRSGRVWPFWALPKVVKVLALGPPLNDEMERRRQPPKDILPRHAPRKPAVTVAVLRRDCLTNTSDSPERA